MKGSRFINEYKISLKNKTPLKIGNGKEESDILIDKNSQKPLIMGSSFAGAFKSYLLGMSEEKNVNLVFGSESKDNTDSKIYISDSYGNKLNLGSRPGIRRDYKYGTSIEGGKYDTTFIEMDTNFEVKIKCFAENKKENEIEENLINKIIVGIREGKVRLGANKMNGFGSFEINNVEVAKFDLGNKANARDYILNNKKYKTMDYTKLENDSNKGYISFKFYGEIVDSLIVKENLIVDYENMKNSFEQDIIPGSTIKGMLRQYNTIILNTLNKELFIIDKIYGSSPDMRTNHTIGRLLVHDVIIENPKYCTYNRIKVDRFTGGVTTGGKFNEKRVKGSLGINISLKRFENEDENKIAIGMVLMTLRDLGLSKITIGSSSSVGSGRIKGEHIEIIDKNKVIKVKFENGMMKVNDNKYISDVISQIEKIKEVM
ncbi:RAMP superfamily CRISPR-associated protein [Terrisporobacter mayombei]|uniref:CRISPR type III-associated protein domain-containing protein n=1 Tax=Terrisporobacter mayombei TaxID=1541 RepID=A0ABY9Q0F0_9FIRM|nr:RAMP superfamily CRISPR-associated protein [Terrisporobacter mayombei]MCC3867933.1 hypothetical protein [Terrisporobacter mayombei]WMT80067.1 hypothetical protein TEMA_03440 [Terrisporobacter mayombei]